MRVWSFPRSSGPPRRLAQFAGSLLVVSLCSAGSGPPAASARQQPPADDAQTIEAYRLTTAGLKQVVNVNRTLLQEMMGDPKLKESLALRAEIEALSRRDALTEAEERRLDALQERMEQLDPAVNPLSGEASSLAEMEARIRKFPPLMRALSREKMEPREYATFWMAFMQAAFVHGFQKSGMLKDPPPGVNMENVKFIAEHAAEIEAMQKELDALGRAP